MKPQIITALSAALLLAGCSGEASPDPEAARQETFISVCEAQDAPTIDCACAERVSRRELDEFGQEFFLDVLKGDASTMRGVGKDHPPESVIAAMRGVRIIESECPVRRASRRQG